ncbi:hypothetical protein A2671_00905 [Candidatus Kaiserbacteria bacterium RIFCSPHIGHO2_01_FULL_49_13]|uniref:Uncharacterized protein n=1 Tax=Candidatus Kaiserbacteria bacterium RIFCSPHIGHO2_01_FULL_49_13 TaxID=1798477 RepID=A0A1F6CCI3_9BACT|nr:MAG: hypothetical protein A2671_00905 [Candidatus Kaiserbacteria bacterium RIFCSPHIGHO2_01_FULL_49_13]
MNARRKGVGENCSFLRGGEQRAKRSEASVENREVLKIKGARRIPRRLTPTPKNFGVSSRSERELAAG